MVNSTYKCGLTVMLSTLTTQALEQNMKSINSEERNSICPKNVLGNYAIMRLAAWRIVTQIFTESEPNLIKYVIKM